MATTAVSLMGIGALNSATGSFFGARAQKTALALQADLARTNARVAELGAQQETLRGQRELQQHRTRVAGLKGSQRAAFAANGIALDSDSVLNVLTSTDVMGEIDANTIEANAVRNAWGYRTQAANARIEGTVREASGRSINAMSSATTSLLGDAGRVASTWYSMNRPGR